MGGTDGEEGGVVILEIAQLQIEPGETAAFEIAFAQVKKSHLNDGRLHQPRAATLH